MGVRLHSPVWATPRTQPIGSRSSCTYGMEAACAFVTVQDYIGVRGLILDKTCHMKGFVLKQMHLRFVAIKHCCISLASRECGHLI